MESFFEKLKRGMGIEEPVEEKIEEEKKPRGKKPPKQSKLPTPIAERSSLRGTAGQAKKIEIEEEPIKLEAKKIEEVIEEKKPAYLAKMGPPEKEIQERWLEPEGQLAIDVYQTETELVIQSAIAGVRPEDLDISIEKDILTIKGERRKPFEESGDYFSQECYWGPFSRQVILPVEIDPNKIEASLSEGILTIRMPKILREKKRRIMVKG